jgi:hypothetical protein
VVALAVDSLGSREIGSRCGDGFPAQATDAYAALKYLSHDTSVDALGSRCSAIRWAAIPP